MLFDQTLIDGTLVLRYKRFLADVRLADGQTVTAHCPNPGSMLGLAEPGRAVLLSDAGSCSARKLRLTWEAVRDGRSWVMVNTMLANRLALESFREGLIPELRDYSQIQPEVRVSELSPERRSARRRGVVARATPQSRIDFRLSDTESRRTCFVEVKSVTLRDGSRALFPDAITLRGRRHLEELARLRHKGHRAALLFLVMRADCRSMAPADRIDPDYGETLRRVAAEGVEILAYSAHVSRRGATLVGRMPVCL